MKTKTFLKHNAINYQELEYTGENEIDTDATHKKQWLSKGKAALEEIAKTLGVKSYISLNPSGSCDRGYVSGFMEKNGHTVYISINDGMQDILFRTAQHTADYKGGSNNTESITQEGFEKMTEWLKNNLA